MKKAKMQSGLTLPQSRSLNTETFAVRLNRLFDAIRPLDRGPIRDFEIVRALESRGYKISAAYLCQLRSGKRSNPDPQIVVQLAKIFGVRPEYFTGEDVVYSTLMDIELRWLALVHDPDVRRITMALAVLPLDVREEVLQLVESGRGMKRSA